MEYTLALDNNSAWLLGTGVANFVSLSGDLLLARNTTNEGEEAPIQGYEVMRSLQVECRKPCETFHNPPRLRPFQDKAHRGQGKTQLGTVTGDFARDRVMVWYDLKLSIKR